MKVALAIATLAVVLPSASAYCCRKWIGKCDDGTQGTPCCAYGPCNVFCCNCDEGCRKKSSRRDTIPETSANGDISATTEAFVLADTGSKGYVTLDDYLKYMNVEDDHQMWVDWFKRHDVNGDGNLTIEESKSK